MPSSRPLRKVRTGIALDGARKAAGGAPLPPGDWFVELSPDILRVFRDAEAIEHVADVNVVDFLDGLATRQIVFVSWG